jgi:hypothetical protein
MPEQSRITRKHLVAFCVVYTLFAGLNLVAATANEGFNRGLLTAGGTLFGPMTGAISRGFQGCCLKFSLQLLPWFAPLLVVGIVAQFVAGAGKLAAFTRLLLWTAGWALWFFSGLISFGHALG